MAFVLIWNYVLYMMGFPILILAAVEFGLKKHSYKWGTRLAIAIIAYPGLLMAIGTFFYVILPRYTVWKNNPDSSVYKVRGYSDNLIYEGYENGFYKFDYKPMGSEKPGEVWLEGSEGVDVDPDIKIGDRCYFYYSPDDRKSDEINNEYPVFSYKAAKICLHAPQEERIAIDMSFLIILHELCMLIVTPICIIVRRIKANRHKISRNTNR